jgi:hypothetical protein
MAEAPSVTTFVMENRLPWPEDSFSAGIGGPFDRGLIYNRGEPRQCSIRSISALGATLCGEVANTPGEEVALELATGQRPAGTIEWARSGEAGIRFKQPIDMLALINRNLVSQPSERRAMPRIELRCGLYVKWPPIWSRPLFETFPRAACSWKGKRCLRRAPLSDYSLRASTYQLVKWFGGRTILPGSSSWKN